MKIPHIYSKMADVSLRVDYRVLFYESIKQKKYRVSKCGPEVVKITVGKDPVSAKEKVISKIVAFLVCVSVVSVK